MKFERETDDRPKRPRPVLDAAMIRLLMLFGMFFGVIYAMTVAAKPETWERLGFGEVKPKEEVQAKQNMLRTGLAEGEQNEDIQIQPEEPLIRSGNGSNNQDSVKSVSDGPNQEDEQFEVRLLSLEKKIKAVNDDFWRQVYDRLSERNRKQLYSLIRFAENEITADSATIELFQKLTDALKRWRNEYESKLFEHLANFPADKEEEKKAWSEILYQVQAKWRDRSLPALTDRLYDREPAENTAEALGDVRRSVKRQALIRVRDGTSISRTKDAIPWLFTLDEMLHPDVYPPESPTDVSRVELSSQPVSYRGKWVRFRGRVRSAKMWRMQDHELGVEQLYVLFLKPEENSTLPYCVVATQLPEGFPAVERQAVEMDEVVEVTGQFFKVRSYRAQGGWRECPLVMCHEPVWFPKEEVAVKSTVQLPGTPWIIAMVSIIAVLAIGVAVLVYTSTSSPRSGAEAEGEDVATGLERLANDPNVETVSERLGRMDKGDQ